MGSSPLWLVVGILAIILFMWPLYTLLAVIGRATYGVLTKVLSNHIKVGAVTQILFLLAASTIFGLLAVPFSGGFDIADLHGVWLAAIAVLITNAIGNVAYFKGIAKLESATTQVAFSSILIWGLILSVTFLGTKLSLIQGLGALVLLFAILLAQYQGKKIKLQPGILLIVLSAASFAGFQVASAKLSHVLNLGTYLVLIYLGSAILVGLPYLRDVKRDLQAARGHLGALSKTAVITAAASVFYYIFAYFAYRAAPDPGLVVLLLTSQVVLAVVLSVIFLKERTGVWLKIIAAVLAMLAAILIKA